MTYDDFSITPHIGDNTKILVNHAVLIKLDDVWGGNYISLPYKPSINEEQWKSLVNTWDQIDIRNQTRTCSG